MEFFLNNNNTNTNTNFKQNYGDNKRHINQSSTMTQNSLQSNDRIFAEFMETENHLMKEIQKQTNDDNWDLLEKLLEDGYEYEEALQLMHKQNKETTCKNVERNYNNEKVMTYNRSFVHPSVKAGNNNYDENKIRLQKLTGTTKEKTDLFSFGDFLAIDKPRKDNINEQYDPLDSGIKLEYSNKNTQKNSNPFSTAELEKQDLKYTNNMIKKCEARATSLNYEDRHFSDSAVLSYADRRKLNILLEDGLKYEEALSYVLKEKDEKPSHTVVTHSAQHYLNEYSNKNEFSNSSEFDNENLRGIIDVHNRQNSLYEYMSDNADVALIDEKIKRKRLELEEYENRLLRYSQKIIDKESSRSPSLDEREEDNYSEPRKPRSLSGAGRKRLKILISKGLKYQEALTVVVNERIDRERRNGLRNEIVMKRENLDNRNNIDCNKRRIDDIREDYDVLDNINYKKRRNDNITEDYDTTEEFSPNDYAFSRRRRHYSTLEDYVRDKPLSGAGRKRISRLVASGLPLQKARAIVIQERDERNARLGRNLQKNTSTQIPSYKNIQPFNPIQHGIKVYIHTRNYPDEQLNNDELYILKKAILLELDKVSPRAPQVRFLSCVFKLGWLQIICADDYSCDWLANKMKTIRPWKGAALKMIVPGQSTVMVHITDTENCHKILDKLKKQNVGLMTENWIILRYIQTKKGNLYIFDIDDFSLETLERNNLTAFYGLGKVRFRLKNPVGKESIPFDNNNSTESRQRNIQQLELDNRPLSLHCEKRKIRNYSPGTSSKHSFH